jgi:hypothetical protein
MNVITVRVKPNQKRVIVNLPFGSTGLTYADLTKVSYAREKAAADVAVTPATMTVGTWVSGGFIEIDATNCPGLYQFGLPDAALLQGAGFVDFVFYIAGKSAQDVHLHVELIRAMAN